MNKRISHRLTREFLHFKKSSLNPGPTKQPFYWNHLRQFSTSKPKTSFKLQQERSSTQLAKPLFSNSKFLSPLQKILDHWKVLPSLGRDDASLARYPNLQTAGGLLRGADYAGTLTFALTGTITAAQSGLDVFGSVVVGIITSVGGGTIRDAIFLNRKPFWTEETEYIWMGLITGLVTFFAWPKSILEWRQQDPKIELQNEQLQEELDTTSNNNKVEYYDSVDGILDTLDAIGLSAFAIIGAQNGIRAKMPLLICAICGMTTATFGGLVRDVLCGRPVRIVHSNTEVYALPALAGATTYIMSKTIGCSPAVRIGTAFATCMGSRFWAIQNDVKLHTWDTTHDNLGVTVRKWPTKPMQLYRNK